MAVDFHRSMTVRNGKGENFSIQFFFAFYRFKKFDKCSDGDGHAMRILTIDDVENGSAALHLANEKKKIHPRCSHEINNDLEAKLIHERFQFVSLFLSEREPPESHEKV